MLHAFNAGKKSVTSGITAAICITILAAALVVCVFVRRHRAAVASAARGKAVAHVTDTPTATVEMPSIAVAVATNVAEASELPPYNTNESVVVIHSPKTAA